MNFRHTLIEKLKSNVAYKVANNSTLIGEIADRVIDDPNYSEIAEELNISSSDIADEIDSADIISEVTDHLDMDDLARAVADKCDMNKITEKVIAMLPCDFMDDLAVQATEEIIEDMNR
jgi:predicted DNA-binding protein YlxM (UPF0122 family)